MKRSRYVSLVGMGATALLLAACDDPNEIVSAKAFTDVAACVADGVDEAACTSAFNAAETAYDTDYPKYASQADCEANAGDGRCEADYPNARNPSFRPVMLGFLMGAALANNRVQPQALVANAQSVSGRATAAGVAVAGQGANVSVPARAATRPAASQIASAHTQSRGGFGATASRVSSAGSAAHSSGG